MASPEGFHDKVEEVCAAADVQRYVQHTAQHLAGPATETQHHVLLQVELELHGVVYIVSVLQHGDELLVVKIEDRESLDTWHGEFAAKCELPPSTVLLNHHHKGHLSCCCSSAYHEVEALRWNAQY
jgi:hypothetical protein